MLAFSLADVITAASLTGIGWKPIAITAGVLGLVYVVARAVSKRRARG